MMSCKVNLLILFVLAKIVAGQSDGRQIEKQILDHILDTNKYDARIAPIGTNSSQTKSGPVLVSVNLYVRSIQSICTKGQKWKTQITFRHQWNDPRLRWDGASGKIGYLTIYKSDQIWIPDTFISNSLSTDIHKDLKTNELLRIYPNGNVLFSTRLTTTLSCPMDLLRYPFDSQVCSLSMASYGFTTEDIVYIWKEGDPVQVTKNLALSQFTLNKYLTTYCTSRTNTGEYSCLKVDLLFKRVAKRYVCQWFVPTAILTLISFISFWMKPNKSLRIKFLTAVLFLLYLNTIYINNKSEANVSYNTYLDCWLSTCVMFVLAAFLEYGLILIIEKFRNSDENKGKRVDPEDGDEKSKKPLVNGENGGKKIIKDWKQMTITSRIDLISCIGFPILFIAYIIVFSIPKNS